GFGMVRADVSFTGFASRFHPESRNGGDMRHPAACFLIPGLLLSIPAAAQGVRAGNNVIVGCTAKAPERSALPRLATPPSGAPDANGLYALEIEWAGAGRSEERRVGKGTSAGEHRNQSEKRRA